MQKFNHKLAWDNVLAGNNLQKMEGVMNASKALIYSPLPYKWRHVNSVRVKLFATEGIKSPQNQDTGDQALKVLIS